MRAGRSIADVQSDIKQILEVDDASASVYVSLSAARLVSVQITGASRDNRVRLRCRPTRL